ncbi:transporter substrate-binding domain-containing protein [Vibrio europaeus]|uniref:substrate-binding periplasmic protein n=1 Tax=Vibrio europaeus TaxID=300876 RepID=UPI00233EDD6B|nr:transporter substrate-binding domain-containing protein [Vibrio europaeus]MDC5820359.1 transporter substrate-binding domain-containing protein [Vibrio europaeus]MDC5867730.1 transporter substrate-binding domain-containing protein [Vibrio europaeus]
MSYYLLLSSTLLLLISPLSLASDTSKVIKIAAGNWAPFIGEKLENYGQVGETIQQVFANQGYQVEFDFYPWKRAYKKASEGEYVATAVWMYAEERTEFFMYSDPVAQEQFVFFHLLEKPFEWQTLADLEGKLLGGGLGYSYGSELDLLLENESITMNRVESPAKAFQLLKYRRVELVPEEKHIGLYSLSQLPLETQALITYNPKPFLTNDSYLMFSKAHPEAQALMKVFNQGLAELKALKEELEN